MDEQQAPPATAPAEPAGSEPAEPRPGSSRLAALLRRLTRVQRIALAIGAVELLVVGLLVLPLGPLRAVQVFVTAVVVPNGDAAVTTARNAADGAYALAVGLLWVLLIVVAVTLWLTVSWRLFRLAPRLLLAALVAGSGLAVYLSGSPGRTLSGWIAIAVLARWYLAQWRRGRFGFTRGMNAAICAQVASICCMIALPLALVATIGIRPLTPEELLYRCARLVDGATPSGRAEMPPECRVSGGTPGAGVQRLPGGDLPSHDVQVDHAQHRIEVTTLATSHDDLRALFDDQVARLGPALLGPAYEVHIDCALAPDAPGYDALLATGWFARTPDGAEAFGLASVDDVVFEPTGRACRPLPLPPGAVTAEAVVGAASRARLPMSNPRDATATCHRLGCLRRTRTDQATITVWPTPDRARDDLDGSGGYGTVRFGQVTTVQLISVLGLDCADPLPDACAEAAVQRLESAAAIVAPVTGSE